MNILATKRFIALKKIPFDADTPGMNTRFTPSLWIQSHAKLACALACLVVCIWAAGSAHAEWSQLEKTEQVTHFFDKDSVKAAHVTRYAWTMTELADVLTNTGTPGAVAQPKVKSTLTRWRVHCITDMVAKLSFSLYEQPQGKGSPLSSQDETEWRGRENPTPSAHIQDML